MSVRRKLFITMASFIVGMGLLFAFITQIVQQDILMIMVESTRKEEVKQLSDLLTDYYSQHNHSWEGVHDLDDDKRVVSTRNNEGSILLVAQDPAHSVLYSTGEADPRMIKRFGIQSSISIDSNKVATLYYYDSGVDYMSKLRIGILDSTRVLLIIGMILFTLVSLLIVYLLARRLTAPLRSLLPVIDRLGKGEFGIQAPIVTKDEYGKVAMAVNRMSKQLEHSEELRKNLSADVAHELRTPLTIIQGKLELAQQHAEPIDPEQLLPLQDELIRLTRLVDDLQQLSLAEAQQLPLDRSSTDMLALLRRIVERIQPDAEHKAIKLTLECHTDMTVLYVDSNRITQVFFNLLVNAIRYTPNGGAVKVCLEKRTNINSTKHSAKNSDITGSLHISIADNGAGIPAEHLPNLFNRFYRTDQARNRNSGGMGLGLAIAREYVLAHSGMIHVDSQLGSGTTFTVILPITA
ncbi:MAG: Sensory transduction histidine kinase [Paenibacillus sp.]|nr:Sensory transduction histidine kinase [Paenibacillus sp.]